MILIPAVLRWCRRLGKKEDERTDGSGQGNLTKGLLERNIGLYKGPTADNQYLIAALKFAEGKYSNMMKLILVS